MSETALHNILSRKSVPSVKTLQNICDALDIELVKMFCTDDELVVKNNESAARILDAFNALSPDTQNRLIWIAARLKGH
jgi:transcriptional regulator with XRE-family HTH domain